MRTTNYKEKDYETIFNEMLTDGYLEQLLSTDEHFLEYVKNREDIENNFVMFLSIYAMEHYKQYQEMTNIYCSNDIELAVNNDLDILGSKCNTIRPQATKSSATLTFSLINDEPLPYDYLIPQNTIVYTDDGIRYATVDDATIVRGEYSVDVGALSVMNGGGNRVEPETLTHTDDLPMNLISVTNYKGSSGNHEAYNDEEYRQLLRNWTYSHIRGTKEAYEEFFANYDGLDDYRLVPRWDGAGTLKIIIDPSDDWIRNDLYEKLEKHTFLLIEDVLITGATNRMIDIKCNVNVDIDSIVDYSEVDYTQIKELVEESIRTYINGGYKRNGEYFKGLGIGEDVVPFQIGLFVASEIPEIKSIDFKDTIQDIDNIYRADEFGVKTDDGSFVSVEDGMLKANYGTVFKSDFIYSNYPYLLESDNSYFTIKIKGYDDEGNTVTLASTDNKNMVLDNVDTYGAWFELVANRDNATLSYIRLYENDSDNDDYNVHICIGDEEIAMLRDVVVTVQGENDLVC